MHSYEFEVSSLYHFQDVAVQNYLFSTYFSVAISSLLRQNVTFWKAGLQLLKSS